MTFSKICEALSNFAWACGLYEEERERERGNKQTESYTYDETVDRKKERQNVDCGG